MFGDGGSGEREEFHDPITNTWFDRVRWDGWMWDSLTASQHDGEKPENIAEIWSTERERERERKKRGKGKREKEGHETQYGLDGVQSRFQRDAKIPRTWSKFVRGVVEMRRKISSENSAMQFLNADSRCCEKERWSCSFRYHSHELSILFCSFFMHVEDLWICEREWFQGSKWRWIVCSGCPSSILLNFLILPMLHSFQMEYIYLRGRFLHKKFFPPIFLVRIFYDSSTQFRHEERREMIFSAQTYVSGHTRRTRWISPILICYWRDRIRKSFSHFKDTDERSDTSLHI